MPEDKMSENKMHGNLTLTLDHTLTGHCPFHFLSTHTHSAHKHSVSLRTLYLNFILLTHTNTHRHTHTHNLSTHALSFCLHTDHLTLCLYTKTLAKSLLLSLQIHCLSVSSIKQNILS